MKRREDLTPLWQAKENGCEKARERLILRFECLVYATRLKRIRHAPERLHEEMESAGRIMLVRCVDEYDRSHGTQFATYAITRIWGAMTTVLRDDDWTPRVERERERDGQPALIFEVVSLEDLLVGDDITRADTLADFSAPVEEQVIEKLERQMLWGLVRALPKERRALILGRYWHGLTQRSYGLAVNRSLSRIAQVEAEAMNQLRRFLEWSGAADGL